MRRVPAGVALAAGAVLAAAAFAPVLSADVGSASERGVTMLKDAPGRDLTVGRCIICHSLQYIPSNAPAMNRAGWQKSIQKMRERFGAPITDEEAQRILDYLAANYSGKS